MTTRPTLTEHRSPWVVFTSLADPWLASEAAALVDCLHDWHGPGHGNQDLAILIEHADDLLKSDFLGLFVSVLAQAAWNTNLRLDGDGELDEWRQRMAQHFVFLLDHTAPVAFTERAARGMDVAVALSDGRLLVTLTDVDWPVGNPASVPWTAGPLSFACRVSWARQDPKEMA